MQTAPPAQTFRLMPTPESVLTIPLVNTQTGQLVCTFDKRELAIALGTPELKDCPACDAAPRIVLASEVTGQYYALDPIRPIHR